MSRTKDGNVQEFSVHDKDNAALAATEEAQDMSRLDRIVVPMPQFVNPNDPSTNAGSINMSLDGHPVEHAEGYGEPFSSNVDSPMNDVEVDDDTEDESDEDARAEWTNADYKDALAKVGLPTSGNRETLKTRLDEWDAQEEEYANFQAHDWIDAVGEVESADDLAELHAAYERSGAEYVTVEEAFTERQSEFGQ